MLVGEALEDVLTFAPAAQVDSLLTALEVTATLGWAMAGSRDSSRSESEQNFDQQVKVVSQPTPRYPQELVMRGRGGRVWGGGMGVYDGGVCVDDEVVVCGGDGGGGHEVEELDFEESCEFEDAGYFCVFGT